MKIGIVINTSWNIYNFRKGLVKHLLHSGHVVYAISPEDSYTAYLKDWGCHHIPVRMENKGTNPVKDLFYTFSLYRIYKKIQPDVVLHFTIKPNIYGSFAARMLNIPVINNVSGLGTTFIRKNITTKIVKWLYKKAFKYPKKVFFQNQDDLELFVKEKLIERKITGLLPGSGICLKTFKPQSGEMENKVFTFLLCARVIYDKGIVNYVEASRILKEKGRIFKCQLLGHINEKKSRLHISKEQIAKWENQGYLEYLGKTKEVILYYQKADCVVLPSFREGTPRSLLEAAAMGKPMITTNVPGCKDMVKDGENGYLCEVRNSKDLADKMQQILDLNKDDVKVMGQKSRLMVEQYYDEKIVIEAYMEAMNKTIKA